MKTIVALATPMGRSGVAIIRLSGPEALRATQFLTDARQIQARKAYLRSFKNPDTGEIIDTGLLLYFPAPHSFTGEEVVELHLHGSPAVLREILRLLLVLPGVELAEPGAFTRQAFLNGKLDLTEVEGLIDLIDAETTEQRRQALRAFEGHIGSFYLALRDRLLRALAYYEAAIDFVDGEIDDVSTTHARSSLTQIHDEITHKLASKSGAERLRDGYRIAIVGAPNAGKSTLINTLAKRDIAIVSSIPGTTRDVIEVHLNIDGFPALIADTAGLRQTDDLIENEGINRAKRWAHQADLILILYDASAPKPDLFSLGISELSAPHLWVANKVDLCHTDLPQDLSISLETGLGIDPFLDHLSKIIKDFFETASSSVITRERHRQALIRTNDYLSEALSIPQFELAAESLRLAVNELGRVTGRVDVEDLLDVIFSDFCIGK